MPWWTLQLSSDNGVLVGPGGLENELNAPGGFGRPGGFNRPGKYTKKFYIVKYQKLTKNRHNFKQMYHLMGNFFL